MARRVPLNDPDRAIQVIAEDGGVILTGFSSVEDVQKVNEDAAPFLEAFRAEVSFASSSFSLPSFLFAPTNNTDEHSTYAMWQRC